MANTRDIRNRIRGVKNTQKITRAMQLVAASKMKKAQDLALEGRPYAEKLSRMLATLTAKVENFNHPFLKKREIKTRGILVISSDRGLCGPLNSNLFREIAAMNDKSIAFISIGKKAKQFISRSGRNLIADFTVSEKTGFGEIRPVIEFMINAFTEGEIDTIEVLYPKFKNTLIQEATLIPFLPLANLESYVISHAKDDGETLAADDRDITFEPDPATILTALLDRFIKREIYQVALDARASEHSARMVAMKAATDNAKNLVDDLTLQYNKARQAGITQEILEITAAAAN